MQMRVDAGKARLNLDRAVNAIGEAKNRQADVVLLPEALNLGWTHPSALNTNQLQMIPGGQDFRRLRAAASKNSIYVCAGLIEHTSTGVFNSAVLISPTGQLLTRHRKIFELDIGRRYYKCGCSLNVVETPLATFGVMICADGFAPGEALTKALGVMGADVVLSPCAWAVEKSFDSRTTRYGEFWERVYAPVAKEYCLWIAAASNVGSIPAGPWKGRQCIGNSLVVGPTGKTVLEGPFGPDAETLLMVEISPVGRCSQGSIVRPASYRVPANSNSP